MYNGVAGAGLIGSMFGASTGLAATIRLFQSFGLTDAVMSLWFLLFVISMTSASGFTFLYRLKKKVEYPDLIQSYENNQNSQVNHDYQDSKSHGSISSVAGAVGTSEWWKKNERAFLLPAGESIRIYGKEFVLDEDYIASPKNTAKSKSEVPAESLAKKKLNKKEMDAFQPC